MDALWEVLDRVILDNGGHIDKHVGDGIMAIWGAQAAQENDPEQAVRAGLEMQAALANFRAARKIELAMPVGVNTAARLEHAARSPSVTAY